MSPERVLSPSQQASPLDRRLSRRHLLEETYKSIAVGLASSTVREASVVLGKVGILTTAARVAVDELIKTPEVEAAEIRRTPFKYGDVVGGAEPSLVRYFAEGYTGGGFDTSYSLLNPNSTVANVQITYYLNGHEPVIRTFFLEPQSRSDLSANYELGPGWDVSAKIVSDIPISTERNINFEYNAGQSIDNHTSNGAVSPNKKWLFAEGYTGDGFDEYLTILNANNRNVRVKITYFLEGGAPPVVKYTDLAANSRGTVVVHDSALGVGRGKAVSAKVETIDSGDEIVVERPMYFKNYAGKGIDGGHNVVGANEEATEWFFAEGYTGEGFDEYITIMNPSTDASEIEVTYYIEGRSKPEVKTFKVGSESRFTVKVHETEVGVGRGKAVSARVKVKNNVGIVAERPMYFRNYAGKGIDGGHVIMGLTELKKSASFAGGDTRAGQDSYILVVNPTDEDEELAIEHFPKNGTGIKQLNSIIANANSRTTIVLSSPQRGGIVGAMEVGSRITVKSGAAMAFESTRYGIQGQFDKVPTSSWGDIWNSSKPKNVKYTLTETPDNGYVEYDSFGPKGLSLVGKSSTLVGSDLSFVIKGNIAGSAKGEVSVVSLIKYTVNKAPRFYVLVNKMTIV